MRSLTIGEVLNRLKDEFDDITISKIRFLEAEGLISPDRTESGYRKFTGEDIDRLRYVLRAQRDRYLPLKVIKEELDRLDAGLPVGPSEPPVPQTSAGAPTALAMPPETAVASRPDADGSEPTSATGTATAVTATELLGSAPDDVSMSASELADAAGLTDRDITQLSDHGLVGQGPTHDAEDLRIARLAAELFEAGLEGRHLRMYRQFADREAALAEQLVSSLLRQRNPDSRRSAAEQVERLATVGGDLHRVLLARQLRSLLRS